MAAGVAVIALMTVLPAVLASGLTVTIAIAWCIWLERNPESQDHVRRLLTKRSSGRSIEVRGRGPNDPDGARATAILNAYVNAEQAHVVRCLLWRRFAIIAVVAWVLEAFTPVVPAIGLVVVALLLGAGAVGTFVWERRTQQTLQTLLNAQAR